MSIQQPQIHTNPKYGRGFPATDVTLARRIVKSGKVQLMARGYNYDPRVSERKAIRAQAHKTLKSY